MIAKYDACLFTFIIKIFPCNIHVVENYDRNSDRNNAFLYFSAFYLMGFLFSRIYKIAYLTSRLKQMLQWLSHAKKMNLILGCLKIMPKRILLGVDSVVTAHSYTVDIFLLSLIM